MTNFSICSNCYCRLVQVKSFPVWQHTLEVHNTMHSSFERFGTCERLAHECQTQHVHIHTYICVENVVTLPTLHRFQQINSYLKQHQQYTMHMYHYTAMSHKLMVPCVWWGGVVGIVVAVMVGNSCERQHVTDTGNYNNNTHTIQSIHVQYRLTMV